MIPPLPPDLLPLLADVRRRDEAAICALADRLVDLGAEAIAAVLAELAGRPQMVDMPLAEFLSRYPIRAPAKRAIMQHLHYWNSISPDQKPTLDHLVSCSADYLLHIPDVGQTSLEQVRSALADVCLYLDGEGPTVSG